MSEFAVPRIAFVPVILLQLHDRWFGEVVFELENVCHFRAAPAVDRLVVVAYHGYIPARIGEQDHQL